MNIVLLLWGGLLKIIEIISMITQMFNFTTGHKKNFTFLWALFITGIVLWLSIAQLNLITIVKNMTAYKETKKIQDLNLITKTLTEEIIAIIPNGKIAVEVVATTQTGNNPAKYDGTILNIYSYNDKEKVVDNSLSRDIKYHAENAYPNRSFSLGGYSERMLAVARSEKKYEANTLESLKKIDAATTEALFITKSKDANGKEWHGNSAFAVKHTITAPHSQDGETMDNYIIVMMDEEASNKAFAVESTIGEKAAKVAKQVYETLTR